jgi:tRNA-specific 2-thiouridylase
VNYDRRQIHKGLSQGRVVIAMSGGVDSSVAAALLTRNGSQVIGVTLQLHACHQNIGRACCGIDGVVQARAVAGCLGIPHYVLNLQKEFEDLVLRPVWAEFARGRTPNPCILCNERIKFGLLLDRVRELGAECVATGHYARVYDGGRTLFRAKDRNKDQSYFLARLNNGSLQQSLFPIGDLEKKEVRELARQFALPNAEVPESQDACLVVPGESFSEMLRCRFGETAIGGPIIDGGGRTIKFHSGIHLFTVGQRRGLGIAAKRKMWVKAIDIASAAVSVTSDASELLSGGLVASEVRWLGERPNTWPLECDIQVRYRQAPVAARVEPIGSDSVRVTFNQQIRAVTRGQAAVFFDGDRVLGSGWIDGSI